MQITCILFIIYKMFGNFVTMYDEISFEENKKYKHGNKFDLNPAHIFRNVRCKYDKEDCDPSESHIFYDVNDKCKMTYSRDNEFAILSNEMYKKFEKIYYLKLFMAYLNIPIEEPSIYKNEEEFEFIKNADRLAFISGQSPFGNNFKTFPTMKGCLKELEELTNMDTDGYKQKYMKEETIKIDEKIAFYNSKEYRDQELAKVEKNYANSSFTPSRIEYKISQLNRLLGEYKFIKDLYDHDPNFVTKCEKIEQDIDPKQVYLDRQRRANARKKFTNLKKLISMIKNCDTDNDNNQDNDDDDEQGQKILDVMEELGIKINDNDENDNNNANSDDSE